MAFSLLLFSVIASLPVKWWDIILPEGKFDVLGNYSDSQEYSMEYSVLLHSGRPQLPDQTSCQKFSDRFLWNWDSGPVKYTLVANFLSFKCEIYLIKNNFGPIREQEDQKNMGFLLFTQYIMERAEKNKVNYAF